MEYLLFNSLLFKFLKQLIYDNITVRLFYVLIKKKEL
jgi:hypothetical protein